MLRDEAAHQRLALAIVEIDELHTGSGEQILSAFEVSVLADDHRTNFEEQRRSGAHHAGTQRTDQHELVPVSPPPGVANADHLGMRRRIASLDAQIVSASDDFAIPFRKYRSDRQPTFIQTFACLRYRREKKLVIVHV